MSCMQPLWIVKCVCVVELQVIVVAAVAVVLVVLVEVASIIACSELLRTSSRTLRLSFIFADLLQMSPISLYFSMLLHIHITLHRALSYRTELLEL